MTLKTLKIATRKSPMALWQANHIKQRIHETHPNINIELVELLTQGDRNQKSALTTLGGKSLFVKELQHALLKQEADIAVHCIKDMSVMPCPGLQLEIVCEREDPRDVFISNHYSCLKELPKGAIVGTSSPRRQSQLKAKRPDLNTQLLRGNVNTRLKKLDEGQYDAIILAAAGLKRLGLENRIADYLDPNDFIPAIGQGALGIECRENDNDVKALIQHLNHKPSQICITAERAVNQQLGGNCYTPLAAYAVFKQEQLHLSGMVGSLDGKNIITSQAAGKPEEAISLGVQLANSLLAKGAKKLLGSQFNETNDT